MAIIGKIRQKQGLLITLVGLAMLLFVVDPSTIWNRLSGGGEQPIAELYGEPIYNSKEYRNKFENQVNIAAQNYSYQKQQSQQDPALTDQEMMQVESMISKQLLNDSLINHELAKLGIGVSAPELNESLIFGLDPAPFLKNQFTYPTAQNPNGVFMRDSLVKVMNQIINMNTLQSKQNLKGIEDQISVERIRQKYVAMIKYGLIGTTTDANRLHAEENTKVAVKYAYQDYNNVPDSLVLPISEEEFRAYFDEHRFEKKWHQEVDMRSFKYVTFDILPSEKDKTSALDRLTKRKNDFINAANDTMFVANNASTPIGAGQSSPGALDVFPMNPHEGNLFSAEIESEITAAKQGEVVGPFVNGNAVAMVKIRETGVRDEANVRHILITSQNLSEEEDAKKKALADSLMRVVKADTSKFSDMVTQFTEDPGSKFTGGVYSWFAKGRMVPEFEDFSFNKPVGSVGVVKTDYGYHIVEVLGQKANEFKMLAIVDANVNASKDTQDEFYGEKALPFYEKVKAVGFDAAVEEEGIFAREANDVKIDNPQITGLPRNMALIKWAFNSEIGSVMEPEYIDGNKKLLVANLTAAVSEGDPEFEGMKEIMKDEIIKEKKAKIIADQLAGATSIDDAATKLVGLTQKAELTYSMNNFPANAGAPESKLIGQVFALEQGVMSEPLAGTNGVYVVSVDAKTPAAANDDLSVNRGMITGNLRSTVDAKLVRALYTAAEAKDWRMKRTIMNN